MKTLITLIAIISTFSTFAEELSLRFWDGTFAYNQLVVSFNTHQNSIAGFELSGSLLNLGRQIEGNPETWSDKDRLNFSLPKSDCKIDTAAPFVQCAGDKTLVRLTWTVNHKISKTYEGLVENLKITASKKTVTVSFTIPSDEQFSPVSEDITVVFFTNSF